MAPTLEDRERKVIAEIQKIRFFPLSVVGGEGSYLIGESGQRILDFSGTWGAATLGYSHPAVAEAVARVMASLPSASSVSSANEQAVALAEELLALVPGDAERRVWFGHCGSDANDAIVRAITAATGRTRFVSFIGGTHGGLSGSLAVSGYNALQLNTVASAHPGQIYLPYPDTYRPPFPGDVGHQVLDYFEYLLTTIAPPHQVAGVFIEALMCDAGDVVPPQGFLRGLAQICQRHGILLICDEVKVGVGRTGQFHAFEVEGIVPDLISYGKALGGGLPLSAAVGPGEVMNNPRGLTITTTAGNPISTAAGRAVLSTILAENLMANAAARGAELLQGLRQLANKHSLIGDVRGRGWVIGVELVRDRQSREPARKACAKVAYRARELGVAVFYVGHYSNVLELTPPITLSKAEVREGLQVLGQAIEDVENDRVSDEALAGYSGW